MKQSLTDKRIEHIESLIDQLCAEALALSSHQRALALRRLRIKLDVL